MLVARVMMQPVMGVGAGVGGVCTRRGKEELT